LYTSSSPLFFKNKIFEQMKKLVVLSFLLVFISNISAQKSEIGIGFGLSTYYGDLSGDILLNNLKQSHPAVQVIYNYYFNRYFNSRISLGHGTVSGDDSFSTKDWQKERNLSFQSSITELSGIAEFNILGINHRINPFLYSGVNIFHYNPKTFYKGEWIYLQPLGTEGQGSYLHPDRPKYSLMDISLIFGGGIKFKINPSLMLSLELGWRRTNSDYLDDISKDYVGYSELKRTNGELAATLADRTNEYNGFSPESRIAGSQRGGDKIKDYYSMSFINIVYTLNSGNPIKRRNKVICPGF